MRPAVFISNADSLPAPQWHAPSRSLFAASDCFYRDRHGGFHDQARAWDALNGIRLGPCAFAARATNAAARLLRAWHACPAGPSAEAAAHCMPCAAGQLGGIPLARVHALALRLWPRVSLLAGGGRNLVKPPATSVRGYATLNQLLIGE